MRKTFLLLAALFTATVMNLQAANVYFKLTAAAAEWAYDGAKIGACFKDEYETGAYAQFFTLVPGTTDTYVGTVPEPEGEEPFITIQFLRYNSVTTNPEDMNYWNTTGIMTWDGVNDMFTATSMGESMDGTTGTWSKYSPAGPDMHDFLHFVGLNGEDTVRLNKIGSNYANLTATFEYSTDRTTWNNYTWPDNSGKGGAVIELKTAGDTVFFRAKGTNGENATVGLNASTNFTFEFGADDQIAAGGNIMSLYDATCEQDTMTECGFYKLFNGAKQLVTAPKLPAKKMAKQCYSYMFNGCTSLIAAPELKATTLEAKCYAYMFQNCTTLQVDTCADDAQCTGALLVVPATGAANWNYKMFSGCQGDAKYTATTGIQLNGHYCIKEYKEPDMHDMLHFVSLKDNGTVRLNKYGGNDLANLTATFEYSKDRKTWTECTWGGTDNKKGAAITLANAGDTVFFRAKGINGKNATMSYNDVTYFLFAFNSGDSIAAGGNVMSLYDATCKQDTMTAYGFCSLFRDCAKKLVSVSELKLPVTKLAKGCYYAMFYNCMKITDVPALPVTTLAPSCYVFMFYRCSSLTVAPELPATTLADNCYSNMFSTCTALTQAPALPATILASKCYNLMFTGCSSLTSAPELKATALADSCYKQMFKGCTKLEVNSFSVICDGVEFEPTTTGAEPTDWNLNMFYGCKGDTALTKTYGIQLGGHYCIREYGKPLPIYGRKLKVAGNYGTICLAKKFTSMEGVEGLYVPASKDASKLYCEEVDVNEVEAGKAYIFKAEAGKDSVTFVLDGEAVPAPVVEEGDYMIGWLAADSTLTAESDYYGLNGNTISKLAAGSKIKQNCAVIDLDNVPAATSAPSRKYVSFGINGTNTTTGVVDVNATRMSDVHKFVYNGQLIIIRDGVEYNAMGVKL